MSVPVVAFFNNKGGVGKTSLVYHVAWMLEDLGVRVVAADLDPQANLSSFFLSEERLEELWPEGGHSQTVFGAVEPLVVGTGDVRAPHIERVEDGPALVVGDLALSTLEDEFALAWPHSMDRKERAFRVMSSFWRVLQLAAQADEAEMVLVDLGPNLGSINRTALIASDFVVVPLAPDLFSLRGLQNLGPALREWRGAWTERVQRAPTEKLELPGGRMHPLGYVVLQHSVRLDRPVRAYDLWMRRIPFEYRKAVLGVQEEGGMTPAEDAHCLAQLRHYRSLMPLAQEARKPIFRLKPADGALGSHYEAARQVYREFRGLAEAILTGTGLTVRERSLPGEA